MEFRATLNFRKFMVALNSMYRIVLNFAKSYILSCLSKFYDRKKIHCAAFEILHDVTLFIHGETLSAHSVRLRKILRWIVDVVKMCIVLCPYIIQITMCFFCDSLLSHLTIDLSSSMKLIYTRTDSSQFYTTLRNKG